MLPRRVGRRLGGGGPGQELENVASEIANAGAVDDEELSRLLERGAEIGATRVDAGDDLVSVGNALFCAVGKLVAEQHDWRALASAYAPFGRSGIAMAPEGANSLYVRGDNHPPDPSRYVERALDHAAALRARARDAGDDDADRLDHHADVLEHAVFLASNIASLESPHLQYRAITGSHRSRARRALRQYVKDHSEAECERGRSAAPEKKVLFFDEMKLFGDLSTTDEGTEETQNTPAMLCELARELATRGEAPASALSLRAAVAVLASSVAPRREFEEDVGFLSNLLELAFSLEAPWVGAAAEEIFAQLEIEPDVVLVPTLAALRQMRDVSALR